MRLVLLLHGDDVLLHLVCVCAVSKYESKVIYESAEPDSSFAVQETLTIYYELFLKLESREFEEISCEKCALWLQMNIFTVSLAKQKTML